MIAQEIHADVEVTRSGSLLLDVVRRRRHEGRGTHAFIGENWT